MGDFRFGVSEGRAASMVGLSVLLVAASACSSKRGSDDRTAEQPAPSGGAGSVFGVGGALGIGAAAGTRACTAPPCSSGGSPDVVVALPNGGKPIHVEPANGGAATLVAGSAGAATAGSLGTGSVCRPPALVEPGCVETLAEESSAGLCNQRDDDCDGSVDEGCPCDRGAVQPCFAGPPARRGVGACADGAQTCISIGELSSHWGDCVGGIRPSAEACDALDNDCNGCADDLESCVPKGQCPGPGDPRTPSGTPFAPYSLRGRDFFTGAAVAWSWTVEGGPCDALTPTSPSFTVTGANAETATFTPKLSGDYTVTLTVTPESGPPFTCTWLVHIQGPGLRIEMCYPESSDMDLDLYVKQPGRTTPWFTGDTHYTTSLDQCCWANCEANLRGEFVQPEQAVPRADWGYPTSPLALCEGGPQGATWRSLGACSSPRLDIDNNLSEATGVPENVNIDAPRDGETFRIMVANFTGTEAHPLVNVYCDGHRTATVGAPPDQLPNFTGPSGSTAIGALWRVADVTTQVIDDRTSCTVNVLRPPGTSTGFDVTVNDARY